MRALGIDFGERRIGVAISDPAGRFALPLTTVERDTDRRAVGRLADLAKDEEIELLVVGEPRQPDGMPGEAAERVRRFATKLQKATGLPVRWVDETLTTVEAAERLTAAGLDPKKHPARLDAVAAQVLLQEALDALAQEAAHEEAR